MDRPDPGQEARWIEEARGGSAEAFARLVELHQVRIRAYIGRYVRPRDVVDDLAQDVFVDAFRRLHTYRGEVGLASWLYGFARNAVLEHLRSEARRRARERRSMDDRLAAWRLDQAEREPAPDPRALEALRGCLDRLPPASADLVQDFYYRSRTSADIARHRAWKESRVRMTLLRIRSVLRDCLQKGLVPPGETSTP